MAWHPITIDDSFSPSSGGAVKVAEGNYLFKLVAVVPSKADYEGEPHFRFQLVFTDGPDPAAKGSKIDYIATFKPEAQFGCATILAAFGMNTDGLKGKTFATYEAWAAFATALATPLHDKPIGGTVIDRTYNGKISSRVNSVWPAGEWENRRGAVIASTQPQPGANGAAYNPQVAAPTGPSADFMADVNAMFPSS